MQHYGGEYVPKKRSRAGIYFMFLLLWAAIGLGAYAWYERTRGERTVRPRKMHSSRKLRFGRTKK